MAMNECAGTNGEMPPKKLINLLRGWPAPSLLPSSLLQRASNLALSNPKISVPALQYAPDEGPLLLRQALSSFLSSFYRTDTSIDRITTTGGASQSFGIALATLTDPSYTRRVWVLEPTYFLAFRVIGDAGLTVESVEDREDGIDYTAWDQRLAQVEKQALQEGRTEPQYKPMPRPWTTKIYKNIFYCVPSFSNPTGRIMSLQSRQHLVRLARKYDALIITDDVYDFLWWPRDMSDHDVKTRSENTLKSVVPRIVDVDRSLEGGTDREGADGFGNALSNGSFSKICGPGVRTGWIEGAPSLAYAISQAGPTRSGGSGSNLIGVLLGLALQNGDLQTHITETLIPSYSSRWSSLTSAIDRLLGPLGASVPYINNPVDQILAGSQSATSDKAWLANIKTMPDAISGGYFMWIKLPNDIDATYFAERLKEEQNVIVQTESQCRAPPTGVNIDRTQDSDHNEEDSVKKEEGKPGPSRNTHIRLCWAWEDEADQVEAIERMAIVLGQVVRLRPEQTNRPSTQGMQMLSTNQFR